ncbi:MAG: glycosyltransferase, partial [Nitrospinota bacterium]|nr:glycosyltransferase [Nitrospinota bacterium]
EYFSTGRPVLAHAPKGSFVLEYIRKHNCGVAIGENDPASLREAIRKVLADKEYVNEITANAKNRAKIDFDSDKMRSRFICYLETMAASGSGMGN